MIHNPLILLDSRLREDDGVMKIQGFYESINNGEKKRSTPTYNGLRASPALDFSDVLTQLFVIHSQTPR